MRVYLLAVIWEPTLKTAILLRTHCLTAETCQSVTQKFLYFCFQSSEQFINHQMFEPKRIFYIKKKTTPKGTPKMIKIFQRTQLSHLWKIFCKFSIVMQRQMYNNRGSKTSNFVWTLYILVISLIGSKCVTASEKTISLHQYNFSGTPLQLIDNLTHMSVHAKGGLNKYSVEVA